MTGRSNAQNDWFVALGTDVCRQLQLIDVWSAYWRRFAWQNYTHTQQDRRHVMSERYTMARFIWRVLSAPKSIRYQLLATIPGIEPFLDTYSAKRKRR